MSRTPWWLICVLILMGCSSSSKKGVTGSGGAAGTGGAIGSDGATGGGGAGGTAVDGGCGAAPSFKRGIGLGNRLDAPTEGAWGPVLHASDFQSIAARGFDHVRLPVRFNGHAASVAPFNVDEEFFLRVDWAIGQALDRCLSVVVDFHHYEELMADPAGQRERFLAIWSQIASRYAAYPPSVAFELLNEPTGSLDATTWNSLLAQTVHLVRTTNPTRDIIVDGPGAAAPSYLSQLVLPDDPNVIAAAHVYEPELFTLQGQTWMPAEYGTTGVLFPGPPPTPLTPMSAAQAVPWVADWFTAYNASPTENNPSSPSVVRQELDRLTAFAKNSGHRVYNKEWAAFALGDLASRVTWMRLVRQESEQHGFGWCVWEDNSATGSKLLDTSNGRWDEQLTGALFD
jgi:endoglucanase